MNRTVWGGGAPQGGDLRLLEDGSERGGALGSDVVETETASEGQDGNGERVGVSMGADTKANALRAGGTLELLEYAILLDAACDDDNGGDAKPLK